ncbi:hypothetical protein O0L34_g16028 [Tuta absoluta]|nr:hypothetical protein O0L34_g16028 [Tuta absoluta]
MIDVDQGVYDDYDEGIKQLHMQDYRDTIVGKNESRVPFSETYDKVLGGNVVGPPPDFPDQNYYGGPNLYKEQWMAPQQMSYQNNSPKEWINQAPLTTTNNYRYVQTRFRTTNNSKVKLPTKGRAKFKGNNNARKTAVVYRARTISVKKQSKNKTKEPMKRTSKTVLVTTYKTTKKVCKNETGNKNYPTLVIQIKAINITSDIKRDDKKKVFPHEEEKMVEMEIEKANAKQKILEQSRRGRGES